MAEHPLGVRPWGNSLLAERKDVRAEGLGLLSHLCDEVVLDLLSALPAASLASVACCSKALYCFCGHEELWKALVLNDERQRFSWLGSWKRTCLKNTHSLRGKPGGIKVNGFYSDLLYQPWFCSSVEIQPAWLEVDNIDRRPGLSAEEFRRHYEEPNRPVLLTGAAARWPALNKWTRPYLQQAFSGKDVIVGNMPVSFREFLKYSSSTSDDMPLYLFDKHFLNTAPQLADDFCIPEVFTEDLFSVLGAKRPDYRWLIMGPSRSGSSFHIDPNATNAWNAVVTGSKKWILYPPSTPPPGVHASADGADVATSVSLVEWFLNFYPEVAEGAVKPVECIARAGDVVFVPAGWWHLVLNLEESVAVTQNYVAAANLAKVLKFLQPGSRELVSGCSMQDRGTLYEHFVAALKEQKPSVWLGYEEQEQRKLDLKAKSARLSALFKQPSATCTHTEASSAGAGGGGFTFNFSVGASSS